MTLEKVYQDLLKEWVVSTDYHKVGRNATMCVLTTKKGFEVIGTTSSFNIDAYDSDTQHYFSLLDAVRKLEELVNFHNKHK